MLNIKHAVHCHHTNPLTKRSRYAELALKSPQRFYKMIDKSTIHDIRVAGLNATYLEQQKQNTH